MSEVIEQTGFTTLGLDERLLATLTKLNYTEPSPIQAQAIPHILQGKDLVGMAGTGTGKTAAFGLPVLQLLAKSKAEGKNVAALVLVPTRELAIQVSEAIRKYGKSLGLNSLAVYGGQSFGDQVRGLRRNADVVVATPGRLADHMRRNTFPHCEIATVVLDEADEMFDMGFAEEIEGILSNLPTERQTLLFSATMPPRIAKITEKFLRNPVRITVQRAKAVDGEKPRVKQTAYVVQSSYKQNALCRLLDMEDPTSAIVFCRTRTETEDLTKQLIERGYHASALHGGMEQIQRDRVMKLFREETLSVLVATDVAARGIDIHHLSHVVNYHIPESPEAYVHRSGRVGRAGREGVVMTIVDPRDQRGLRDIERLLGQPIVLAKVPTVAQLKTRQMERTVERLKETLLTGDLEDYRPILEKLTDGTEPTELLLAAIKLAHLQGRSPEDDEQDIPEPNSRRPVSPNSRPMDRGDRDRNAGRFGHDRGPSRGPTSSGSSGNGGNGGAGGFTLERRPFRPEGQTTVGMTRLFFSLGREAGVTPRDMVGAIANESGINSRDIGAIDIADRFTLVDIADDATDHVIEVMQDCRIKGRKVMVRRERDGTPVVRKPYVRKGPAKPTGAM
jgi:ATP-dependent RNA helicase DeaD